MVFMHEFIKPISHYINTREIKSYVQKADVNELQFYLSQYGINVWKLSKNMFIALDFETSHKNLYRVSMVSTPLNVGSLLKLSLELKYGVKLYTEQDLRNILSGLILHKEYSNTIGFLAKCETEVKVISREKRIAGIADIVCDDFVIEIKLSSSIRKEHLHQLLLYMDLLNKPKGFLVYENNAVNVTLNENINLLLDTYKRIHEISRRIKYFSENLERFKDVFINKFNMKVCEIIQELNKFTGT